MSLFANLDRELDKLLSTVAQDTSHIPKLLPDFAAEYQRTINGRPRNLDLYPFMKQIFAEKSPEVYFSAGRQLSKSTLAGSILAHRSLLYPNSTHMCLLENQPRAAVMSEIKIRQNAFLNNPDLAYTLLEGGTASVSRIRLYNNSSILIYSCFGNYRNSEGSDNMTLIFDEFQNHVGDIAIPKYTTTAFPESQIWYFSIGGDDSGSASRVWRSSSQNEWSYSNQSNYIDSGGKLWEGQGWRQDLTFDESGRINNSSNDLQSMLDGTWTATNTQDPELVGYHIGMPEAAIIPISEADAKNLYNTSISKSIQYMQRHYAKPLYIAHTLGAWYRSSTRGLSRSEFEMTYQPKLRLLSPEQIAEIVHLNPDEYYSFAGIDWGSNIHKGRTVLSICLYHRRIKRMQLAYIDKPSGLTYQQQVSKFLDVIKRANVTYTVADLGFGHVQCELMKEELRYEFSSCVTSGNLITEGAQEHDQDTDREKKTLEHLTVNKTKIIDDMIHEIQSTIPDEKYPDDESLFRSSFMVPTDDFDQVFYLVDDFTSISIKSHTTDLESEKPNPNQSPKREYNHIPDTVASIILCCIARDNHNPMDWIITPVRKKRFR